MLLAQVPPLGYLAGQRMPKLRISSIEPCPIPGHSSITLASQVEDSGLQAGAVTYRVTYLVAYHLLLDFEEAPLCRLSPGFPGDADRPRTLWRHLFQSRYKPWLEKPLAAIEKALP